MISATTAGYSQFIPGTPMVVITNIPKTIDEFVEMRDRIAVTPIGGAASFIVAMLVYTRDIYLGIDCFTASLVNDSSLLRRVQPGGYEGLEPIMPFQNAVTLLQREPWVANSYIYSTRRDNAYRLGEGPYKIVFNPYNPIVGDDGIMELEVYSTGVPTPRRISVRVNNRGIWKVWRWEDVIKSILAPEAYLFYEDDI